MPTRRTLLGATVPLMMGLSGCSALPIEPMKDVLGMGDQESTQTQTERGNSATSDSVDDEIEPMGEWGTTVEPVDGPPEEVVKRFYDALYSADVDTANEMLHPESDIPLYTRDAITRLRTYDVAIEDFTINEESSSHVIVEYQLIVIGLETVDRSQRRQTLRKDGEKWRIFD